MKPPPNMTTATQHDDRKGRHYYIRCCSLRAQGEAQNVGLHPLHDCRRVFSVSMCVTTHTTTADRKTLPRSKKLFVKYDGRRAEVVHFVN